MAVLETTNLQDNEILKAVDVNNGFDAQITNVSKALLSILETNKDFIICNENNITANSESEDDWNIKVGPIFGICASTELNFVNTENSLVGTCGGPVDGKIRCDTIEVKGIYETYDKQKRAFIDFDTQATTIESVDTKKRLNVTIRCLPGTDGSVQAPAHTAGWVKIGEILVPPTATKISDCTIRNVTCTTADESNTEWSYEKSSVYNLRHYSTLMEEFRVEHKKDGTHESNCIHQSNIDIGNSEDQVNAKSFPISEEITVNTVTHAATDSIFTIIKALNVAEQLDSQNIEKKVDKEDGKGLSTNDYTTDEKTVLNNLSNLTDYNISAWTCDAAFSIDFK